jgi:DNA modification methylase
VTSINSLLSDHKNARRRTDRSAELIKESLQRYGAARSIVIDEDNRILAGNGTIEGAKAAGIKNVRIIETDGTEVIAIKRSGLSEDEKVGLALADNRTADLSEWDQAMLHTLSQEHDLSPWFEQEDLNELLAVTELPPEEGKTDPDDVPEPPADPTTKPGDLWILGNHRLLCGDSTNIQHVERLMDGQRPGAVVTDPPYGINANKQTLGIGKKQFHRGDNWDAERPDIEWLQAFADQVVIWGGNYFADTLPPTNDWLCWHKKNDGRSFSEFELAWTNLGKNCRILSHHWGGEEKQHPTQKPCAVIEWCLQLTDGSVFDPFSGSGTTFIAAEKARRPCYGMELDPAYCDVIVKRWEDFTGNTAVCHPSDAHFSQPELEDF